MPHDVELVYKEGFDPAGKEWEARYKNEVIVRSRKHQGKDAMLHYERIFTDKVEWNDSYHSKWKPQRDDHIPIKGPHVCSRKGCRRRARLQRDHVVPLYLGGKDVEENLQWLCETCHRVKTVGDRIRQKLKHLPVESWRFKMWSYRLEALERLNPPGQDGYRTYWADAKTHYDVWYQRPPKKVDAGQQVLMVETIGE
jgi:5-methylcytosine-specific restriction endonuclease McrA